jgi:hypothetical protein
MILYYITVEEDIGKVSRLQQLGHILAPGAFCLWSVRESITAPYILLD